MDNPTAKEILSAYRPHGSDAADAAFQDALHQCEDDPALRAWFASERAFDERMSAALGKVRAPVEGKQAILATSVFSSRTKRSRRWHLWGLGLAAILLISPAWLLLMPSGSPTGAPPHAAAIAVPSLAELAENALPLDFEGRDTTALLAWLAGRKAPQPYRLPDVLAAANAAGCRVFDFGEAGQVSLLCFEIDGSIVHFFIFDERSGPRFAEPADSWTQQGDWHLLTFEDKGRLMAFATTTTPTDLGFPF
ncbi:MAG: hypothetical protein JJT96_05070 [Opitutales bacterium]|nr:hypothetical protein [Opitutales bacterium]